jgi:outer membrane cobalamin receptor
VRLNPQAAWTHRLDAGLSVRVLGGWKTRFPTLKEWFSPEIGNPDLRPERCFSAEIEVTKRAASGSGMSLVVYEQRASDMIATSGWGDAAVNIGSVRSRGAELSVGCPLTGQVHVDLALAMTSARDMELDRFVLLVPRTACAVAVTYERDPVRCVARASRIGSRSGSSGESLPAYYLLNARVLWDVGWATLFAGVENALDALYEDDAGFPQPGRSLEVGFTRNLF